MRLRLFLLMVACVTGLVLTPVGASGRPPPDAANEGAEIIPRVTLRRFAHDYGFSRIQVGEKNITLQGRQHTLVLEKDSRRALLNDTLLWLNQPLAVSNRQWSLAQVDVELTLRPILQPATAVRGKGHRIIVLDPGHGGEDAGAIAPNGLLEKAVVLDIALRTRAHLATAGHTVLLTRHQDQFLSLEERSRRAKAWRADLFVSIHGNGGSATASGAETFALSLPGQISTNQAVGSRADPIAHTGNAHNAANILLAHLIQKELVANKLMADRGVKRARFAVLKNAPAPAALVEVGFLSNPTEAELFVDPTHRDRIALAIARGIDAYVRETRKAALAQALRTP